MLPYTEERYRAAVGLCGALAVRADPRRFDINSPPTGRVALYLPIGSPTPTVPDGFLRYVGSVRRANVRALAQRRDEHFKKFPERTQLWLWLAVIPLDPEATREQVWEAEGRVARLFGLPCDLKATPLARGRGPGVRRWGTTAAQHRKRSLGLPTEVVGRASRSASPVQ